jgi:hypothetical protein
MRRKYKEKNKKKKTSLIEITIETACDSFSDG